MIGPPNVAQKSFGFIARAPGASRNIDWGFTLAYSDFWKWVSGMSFECVCTGGIPIWRPWQGELPPPMRLFSSNCPGPMAKSLDILLHWRFMIVDASIHREIIRCKAVPPYLETLEDCWWFLRKANADEEAQLFSLLKVRHSSERKSGVSALAVSSHRRSKQNSWNSCLWEKSWYLYASAVAPRLSSQMVAHERIEAAWRGDIGCRTSFPWTSFSPAVILRSSRSRKNSFNNDFRQFSQYTEAVKEINGR